MNFEGLLRVGSSRGVGLPDIARTEGFEHCNSRIYVVVWECMKAKNRAHIYTVELSILGTMDPDIVTAETGLQPCAVRRAEIDQDGKILHKSRWTYNGGGESGAYEWDTLEEGLEFVLDRVSSSVDIFKKYSGNQLVTWWCGHFQSSLDGGPILSPHLLKRLGDFGADLFIDNYFTPED